MAVKRAARYGLILIFLSITSADADLGSDIKPLVVPLPPSFSGNVDTKNPFKSHFTIKKGPVSVTVTASPVAAPPAVKADGNGELAKIINKGNEVAQAPKNLIEKKGDEIGNGIRHLGNEIGMLWAKFKQNLRDKA